MICPAITGNKQLNRARGAALDADDRRVVLEGYGEHLLRGGVGAGGRLDGEAVGASIGGRAADDARAVQAQAGRQRVPREAPGVRRRAGGGGERLRIRRADGSARQRRTGRDGRRGGDDGWRECFGSESGARPVEVTRRRPFDAREVEPPGSRPATSGDRR
jgi:hypothetical protein